MKKLILISLLIISELFAQAGYTVQIEKTDQWWGSKETWKIWLKANLFYNGTPVPNSQNYYYYWGVKIRDNGNWQFNHSGLGKDTLDTDQTANFTLYVYVVVTDTINHTFTDIRSDTMSYYLEGNPKLVTFKARRQNGDELSNIQPNHWRYTVGKWAPDFSGFLTLNYQAIIKSFPYFIESSNNKFYYWNQNTSDIQNYNSFNISSSTDSIIAHYKVSNGGIQINALGEGYTPKIMFKDPWLVDTTNSSYYTAPYGYHSLGMSTPYDTADSPLYLTFQSKFKGVFLNQSGPPNWNPPYYSISIPSSIYLTQTGKTHNIYLQSWDLSGASLEHPDSLTTGVVFTSSSGASVTANVKATQLSDNQNAFINSSQRKFVKTPDGVMHLVYESMGRIWYETSTDNGTTWQLMNGGKPLATDTAKLPSIDYIDNFIAIVFQEKSGAQSDIMMSLFYKTGGYYQFDSKVVIDSDIGAYSIDADPVTAWDYNYNVLTVWKQSKDFDQLVYKYASIFPSSFTTLSQGIVTNSTVNSTNPTIYQNSNYPNQIYFHLAWEERTSSAASKIYYERLYPDENNNFQFDNFSEVSYKSGYSKNYSPSITGTYSNYIKLVWIGYRDNVAFGPGVQQGETKVLFKGRISSSGWSSLYVFGNGNIQSVNINKSDDEKFAFAWSEGSGSPYQNKYVRSNEIPTTQRTLSTTGKDLQVNNGTTLNSMFANSFQSQTIPYSFSLSENLSGGLSKQTGLSIFKGREGVVVKDTAQFYFAVGDITLNGDNIDFVEIEDTVNINNRQMLNNYLITQPFTVNDNSTLTYGVQYGITDSASAVEALSDGTTINFSVELFDNQTGEVIGLFDNVTYSQNDVFQYNNIGYEVDMSGIGNRTVRFQLIVNTEADYEYSLSKRYADEEILGKSGKKQVKYQGSLAVTDYAIEQNYPNPFNPSTTIRYRIPQNGFVTLKVYDILGKEVATLVNEVKASGRYEVNFNASSLASGVYLYRLNVNDYVDVKKMLLLK